MARFLLPSEIAPVLNQVSIEYCLIGAHASSCWMAQPLALHDEDVDIVVVQYQHGEAVRVLRAAFPHLRQEDHHATTKLFDGDEEIIDILKPAPPLYDEAGVLTHRLRRELDGIPCYIPTLEMAIAMKLRLMFLPGRDPSKQRNDAQHLGLIMQAHPEFDRSQLEDFAQRIGGAAVQQWLDQLRASRPTH